MNSVAMKMAHGQTSFNMKNWKTTTLGILAIIGAVADAASCSLTSGQIMSCIMEQWPAMVAGFGLLFAKDYNASGKQK